MSDSVNIWQQMEAAFAIEVMCWKLGYTQGANDAYRRANDMLGDMLAKRQTA